MTEGLPHVCKKEINVRQKFSHKVEPQNKVFLLEVISVKHENFVCILILLTLRVGQFAKLKCTWKLKHASANINDCKKSWNFHATEMSNCHFSWNFHAANILCFTVCFTNMYFTFTTINTCSYLWPISSNLKINSKLPKLGAHHWIFRRGPWKLGSRLTFFRVAFGDLFLFSNFYVVLTMSSFSMLTWIRQVPLLALILTNSLSRHSLSRCSEWLLLVEWNYLIVTN